MKSHRLIAACLALSTALPVHAASQEHLYQPLSSASGEGSGVRGGGLIQLFEVQNLMEEIAVDIEENRLRVDASPRLKPEEIRALIPWIQVTERPEIKTKGSVAR